MCIVVSKASNIREFARNLIRMTRILGTLTRIIFISTQKVCFWTNQQLSSSRKIKQMKEKGNEKTPWENSWIRNGVSWDIYWCTRASGPLN